jgi:hypothetical protein
VSQLRSAVLAVLVALIAAASPQSVATQQHSTTAPQAPAVHPSPVAASPSQRPRTVGTTNSKGTTNSACSKGPIEFQFLAASDSQALAKLLNTIFPDVKVVPGLSPGTDKDKTPQPNGTLCVEDRVAGKEVTKCDPTQRLPGTAAAFCVIQRIVAAVDIDTFEGGKLKSNFVVHLPALNGVPLPGSDAVLNEPYSVAKALYEYLSHAAANLQIQDVGQGYFVLLPSPGGVEQAAKVGEDLSAQAGLVKRDLELLDQLYSDAKWDVNFEQSFLCDLNVECPPGRDSDSSKAQIDAERWLARHTVRLSILKPRDAALALQDLPGWTLQVRSYGQALSILPKELSGPRSIPAYLSADAIERDNLYRQKVDEDKAAFASKPAEPSGKSSNGTPPATTTQSTTTLETLSGGKPTAPALTTKVTTTTGPVPNPEASSAPGGQTPSQKSATTDSSTPTDTANAPATQTQKSDTSSGTKSADNSKNPAGADTKEAASASAAAPSAPSQQVLRLDNVVRLFHLRQADKIADAINKAASSKDKPLVQAVDDNGNNDLILILPSPPGGPDQTTSIRRAIAMFDLPRPQLSLQVWSYQLSAEKKPLDIQNARDAASSVQRLSTELKHKVNGANDKMTAALEEGFGALLTQANDPKYFNQDFKNYLTQRFNECIPRNTYCLGFYDALDLPSQGQRATNASLNRLLLYLIAASDTAAPLAARKITCAMNDFPTTGPCSEGDGILQVSDCTALADPTKLNFTRFCAQLTELAAPRNLHTFQAALLDFLFQYRWTITYPDDFVPYDLQRTAHLLDSLFGSIVDSFNQDLDEYVNDSLEAVANRIEDGLPPKKIGLISQGSVQVSSLSGSQASVDGKVNNYFDITPPLSLNDILNVGNQSNIASNLKNVLEPKEILALQALANIGNQPRITAEITKQAKLTITPTTLDTAASALLDVDFDVSEPNPPQSINQKDSQKDLLDRVAEHHVITHVRVESLKLFQLSSFSMELTHPLRGTPVPAIGWAWEGIFGTTPGMGRLFRMPPYSKTVDNRSYAIVRAVVVPTAMDLGLSLRFEADRVVDPITDATDSLNSMAQAGGRLRPFHKCFMQRIVNPNVDCPATLSQTPEDLRDPTTP